MLQPFSFSSSYKKIVTMKTLFLPFLLLLFVISCSDNDTELLEKKTASYDVYLGGIDDYKACYWKNGQQHFLPGGQDIQASQLVVDHNDIYIMANNVPGTNTPPTWYFWKNGIKYNVADYINEAPNTNSDKYKLQIWNRLTIYNGDIYFTGIVKNPNPTSSQDLYQHCYWKNGIKTVLETFGQNNQFAFGCLGVDNNNVYVALRKNFTNNAAGMTNWDLGYYKNNTYNAMNGNLFPRRFITDQTGLHMLLRDTNNTFHFKNMNGGNDIQIPATIAQSGIEEFYFENSDIYYIGKKFYYKNNTLVQINDPAGYNTIGHFVAKDQNIYMTRYNTDTNGTGVKFYINNVEAGSIADISRGCFNSIFVVKN